MAFAFRTKSLHSLTVFPLRPEADVAASIVRHRSLNDLARAPASACLHLSSGQVRTNTFIQLTHTDVALQVKRWDEAWGF